jgi:hypothetical protein
MIKIRSVRPNAVAASDMRSSGGTAASGDQIPTRGGLYIARRNDRFALGVFPLSATSHGTVVRPFWGWRASVALSAAPDSPRVLRQQDRSGSFGGLRSDARSIDLAHVGAVNNPAALSEQLHKLVDRCARCAAASPGGEHSLVRIAKRARLPLEVISICSRCFARRGTSEGVNR